MTILNELLTKGFLSRFNKNVSTFSKRKIFWVILVVIFTIPALLGLCKRGFFPMQDDLQAFRVYEMDKCFQDFQIPCRWVPDAGYKYGYPQFNFYPPLPYYLGAVMHRIGIQYIDVVKILFVFGYVLSALTMYIFVSDFLKSRWSGFVVSVLYTYIPYKAVEVYVRGALSEFWAQIFFPLILWTIYKLIKTGNSKYLIWMSISIFFLMTTHVLMTMIFVPIALIWAVFWLFENRWKNFNKIFWGGLLGFGLSAFFVLPVLFEKQFVHTEGILSGYFDYRQHFVSLYKLFISREWGYGSSGFPNEKLNLSLGIIQWFIGLVVTPILAVVGYRKTKKISILALGISVVSLLSIFMIHMKSSFIWAKLPFLWYLQFPWRFLAVSIFLLCLSVGIAVYLIPKGKYLLGTVIMFLAIVSNISFFVPKDWLTINDSEKFSGISWQKQLTISIFDYLPIYAKLPPITPAPDFPEILDGKAIFLDYRKGSDFQIGNVEIVAEATIRLPLFDFPGMVVKVNGVEINHTHSDCRNEEFCLGLISFKLPNGKYTIEAELTDTPVRKIGNYLTLASIIVVFWLIIKKNDKTTK
jgi:hypothetical protein